MACETDAECLGPGGDPEEVPATVEEPDVLEGLDGHRGFPVLPVLMTDREGFAEATDLVGELAPYHTV
jgi:hypothetical protein